MSGREMAIDMLRRAKAGDAHVVGLINGGEMVMHTAAPRGAAELVDLARALLSTAADMLITDEANAATDAEAEPAIELRLLIEDVLAILPDPDADDNGDDDEVTP